MRTRRCLELHGYFDLAFTTIEILLRSKEDFNEDNGCRRSYHAQAGLCAEPETLSLLSDSKVTAPFPFGDPSRLLSIPEEDTHACQ